MAVRSATFRDDNQWVRSTFVVSLGVDFETYEQSIRYSSSDEIFGTDGQAGVDPVILELANGSGEDEKSPTPVYFTKSKSRDTSLGGNPAINPYFQYGEDDDPMPPLLRTEFGNSGMGRVYSEAIDDNQQILYLTCGVQVFNTATSFYSDAIITDLANMVNNGSRFSPKDLGRLFGYAVSTLITLPVIPLIFIYNALSRLTRVKITKYYDLRPDMPLYYRFVNTIIISLAVNMGLAKDGRVLEKSDSNTTGSTTQADMTYTEQFAASQRETGGDDILPESFSMAGWDIYRIMLRPYYLAKNLDIRGSAHLSTDQAIEDARNDVNQDQTVDLDPTDNGIFENYFDGFFSGLYDANTYVGFRVEKGVDTSESISNQTGESQISQTLNSKFQSYQNLKNSVLGGNLGGGVVGEALGAVVGAVKGLVEGAADVVGVGGAAQALLGSGVIDVPEIWTGSSFSKNYTFTMQLRSPYGDPISIMQSIYIPLALILGASMPRAVGANSYTSPFLVRAYCKGMLGIPLGMIDSVNIRRGSDQHGWNNQRLPTAIDVTFTIKDLSPALYMGMSSGTGLWDVVMGENSSFQEYLQTLGGLGLNERIRWIYKVRREVEIFRNVLFKNILSPVALGMSTTTGSLAGRLLQAASPRVFLPNN